MPTTPTPTRPKSLPRCHCGELAHPALSVGEPTCEPCWLLATSSGRYARATRHLALRHPWDDRTKGR